MPERVLLDRRAVEHQAAPVEIQPPSRPGDFAQADRGEVAGLVAHGERQVVEVRASGRPQGRRLHRGMGSRDHGGAVGQAGGGEAQRDRLRAVLEAQGAGRSQRAVGAVVAQLHVHAHARLESSVRCPSQPRADLGRLQLAGADRPHAYLTVDPAEVEPRAVKAGPGLGRGIAPVGSHHHRVVARGDGRAELEGQIGANVGPSS